MGQDLDRLARDKFREVKACCEPDGRLPRYGCSRAIIKAQALHIPKLERVYDRVRLRGPPGRYLAGALCQAIDQCARPRARLAQSFHLER